ncbi:hypothetical protein R1flu_012488 [Riccia fluitans]|uniref:Ribosomal protein L2 n=1 Tax=Riccia fluitans TaxID=41844 RepID=A0ABD1ZAR6_9MARC
MLILAPYRLLGRFGRLMSTGRRRGHGHSGRKASNRLTNVQSPLKFLLRGLNGGTPKWKLVFPVSRKPSRPGKLSLPPIFGMASLVRVFPAMSNNSSTSAALFAKTYYRSPNTASKPRTVKKRVTFSPDCK